MTGGHIIRVMISKCRGVVVITTAQRHSTTSELRFCASQNLLTARRRFVIMRISENGPG